MSNTTSNRPTHRIYAVTKGRDDKTFWNSIGAAWAHKDGDGFNLRFDQFPVGDGEIVIRKAKPKAASEGPQAGAKGGAA
jgi:hypothetical protein